MYSVKVIGDDLTGAMDTSQGFAARGYATTVVADPNAEIDAVPLGETPAILGINTDSRYDDENDAINSVVEAIETIPARSIYKKVDSTLRGNFAAEIDAALTASGANLALVAPAFPSAGRTTEDGIHYVNGTPVADTESGEDEKGPISSSISELFKSVDRPIENVSLATVDAGSDQVAAAIADSIKRDERAPILVCDAREDTHLETAAKAAAEFDTLYVGSGGLAEHITVPEADTIKRSSPQFSSGAALGVAGSVSTITLTQLEQVADEAIVRIDGASLLTGDIPDAAIERTVRRLQNGRPVILTAATSDEAVEQTLTAGREQGLTAAEVRNQVAAGLAAAATAVLRTETPSGLLLTGGDIAVAVIQALGATAITLTGEEVEAGIPIGTFVDGPTAGMPLVTKAGGFGSEETIVNCLDVLARTDE